MCWLTEQSTANDLIFAFHVMPREPWEGRVMRPSEHVNCPVREYSHVHREDAWPESYWTRTHWEKCDWKGVSQQVASEGTTVSKYQRKSKTRVTIWTLFKTQRHRGRGYAILFTLTHQQRLGLQQLNACTTGEDIRPDLRIKAIKKKVNLFLCSRLRRGKQ